jgi:hypothetical protein
MVTKNNNSIINEITENNFLENVNIEYKLNIMLRTIDIIINEINDKINYWQDLYDKCEAGFFNKILLENCLNNTKETLISAKNAKKNIIIINKNNKTETNYNMYKYHLEITHINKLNLIIEDMASQLLKEDQPLSLLDDSNNSDDDD